MSAYLVAGATGRVGAVVASELFAAEKRVRALVRRPERAGTLQRQGVRIVTGVLEDSALLTDALRGIDGFFALLPEDPISTDFHGDRRRIADSIAAAVRSSGVPHVVLLSAVAAVLPTGNGPAADLHYLENALRETGTRLTVLRACWLQENIATVLQPALNAHVYPNFMASADAVFPTIATRDVGRIAAAGLLAPADHNETIDLVGPAYSTRQLADILGSHIGHRLEVIDIPPAAQVAALTQAGLSQSFAEAVTELYACFAAGEIMPKGDRFLVAGTTVQEVLATLLPMPNASA
jgi:uncharacterized protein YbjT (DUF2867 family)